MRSSLQLRDAKKHHKVSIWQEMCCQNLAIPLLFKYIETYFLVPIGWHVIRLHFTISQKLLSTAYFNVPLIEYGLQAAWKR